MAPSGAPRGLANECGSIAIAAQLERNNPQALPKFPRLPVGLKILNDTIVKTV
jgi:hypothetical protein